MKSYYTIPVAGKKWWSRIFFDLFDRAIYNSFLLEQESPNHAKRSQKDFRIDLAKQLIGNFTSRRKRGRPSDEPLLARHVEVQTFFPTMRMEKGKKGDAKCATAVVSTRKPATITRIVMLAFVLHLALDFFISHRYVCENFTNIFRLFNSLKQEKIVY